MGKEGNRERGGRGVNRGCNLYSGVKRLGGTSDIFTYSVRFSHVVWHRFKVSDQQNDGEGSKGGGHFQYLGIFLWFVWIFLKVRRL